MQGRRKGVVTQIRAEQPAAVAVHCFAHSLTRQDAGRNLACIRDAIELYKDLYKLIQLSPKTSHLFLTKLQATCSSESQVHVTGLKPLCLTRWTVRTGSIDVVIKDYNCHNGHIRRDT